MATNLRGVSFAGLKLIALRRSLVLSTSMLVLVGCAGGENRPGPATWRLAKPVTAHSMSVDLLITEVTCSSRSSPEGRILDPLVVYGPAEITIIVKIAGLSGVQTCPGNPEYPLTVHLTEPVGYRDLVGGSGP